MPQNLFDILQAAAPIGFTGSQGGTGFTGSVGGTGFTGSVGDTGFTGSVGFTGSQGAGFTGSAGAAPAGQLFISGAGMWGRQTGGAAQPVQVQSATNLQNLYYVDFADGATKLHSQAVVAMPSDWNGGTVTATFYWTANSTSTAPVLWGCQAIGYNNFETIDAAFGVEQTVADSLNGVANQLAISAATPAITVGGTPAAGELVVFQFSRNPAAAGDTLAATARLVGVMINYTRV